VRDVSMIRVGLACCALLMIGSSVGFAAAPKAGGPDWPCPQRKVDKLGASDLQWAGPPIETVTGWRQDNDAVALVKVLASRRVPVEEAVKALKAFAEKVPAADRKVKLTVVFVGLLDSVNEYRSSVISGIERFNKRQKARALEIEAEGVQLGELQKTAESSPAAKAAYDKAYELYDWNTRVFEDRRQNLPLACEIPPSIDGRTFELVKEIQALMGS
jgi:hypothetical protein